MNDPILEILIILLLLIANGIFAMSEMAIIAARKARLQQAANKGDQQARKVLDLANNPNNFLSSIQIGITLIGVLAGAFGGATIAEELEDFFNKIPYLTPYSEPIAVGVVVLAITYLSLIIGELVPKRLALNNPESVARFMAGPMHSVSKLAYPLVRFLSASTDLVIRLLGIRPSTIPSITEEEIKLLIEQGTQIGIFEEEEQEMIEAVLRFGEQRISAFMTPRPQIAWINVDDTPDEILSKIKESKHSRFPVIETSEDNVIGVVQSKDLLAQSLAGQVLDIKSALYQPLFVPEATPAISLLNAFKQQGIHIALVIDEYGDIQGIVTSNDILEAIVGYFPSIDELGEPEIVKREDGSWLLDGLLNIDRLKEILGVENLPEENRVNYLTVGGFVVSQLDAIPSAGDHFDWGKYRFEVVDMDGRRVDKVLVAPIQIKSANGK